MQDIVMEKLHDYIRVNNPDLLLQLEEDGKTTEYLSDKVNGVDTLLKQPNNRQPDYIVFDACMDVLTEDLKPSKYNYIYNILEEEFEDTFLKFRESGILQFEAINIIQNCESVFNDLNFSEENEDNHFIRYAITGMINEYLQSNRVNENVSNELQQSTKTER